MDSRRETERERAKSETFLDITSMDSRRERKKERGLTAATRVTDEGYPYVWRTGRNPSHADGGRSRVGHKDPVVRQAIDVADALRPPCSVVELERRPLIHVA